MDASRRLALKVGALVLAGVVLTFAIVMVLGREQMWFRSRVTLHAGFPDVGGLQEGATVRLGGRVVGIVTSVRFDKALEDPRRALRVTMRIRAEYAPLVRHDSRVRIATQGLLGDRLIELTIGTSSSPPLRPDEWLYGEVPASSDALIAAATEATRAARDELSALLAETHRLLARIERGPGAAHSLIYDDAITREAGRALAELRTATGRLGAVAEQLGGVADRMADTTEAVAAATEAVDARALGRASRDTAAIVADVKAGRGTIGGLLVDPTIYEETKQILVNIRRNKLLRLVARFVIKRSHSDATLDASPTAVTVHPRPAPTPRVRAQRPGKRRQ